LNAGDALTGSKTPTIEDLLQFLYLMPVGVVKFRVDGTVDMMNPVASALLLSLTPTKTLQNLYPALASLVPDLHQQAALFVGPAGTVIDQQRLEARAGGTAMVVSLTVNKIKDNVLSFLPSSTTFAITQSTRSRWTASLRTGTNRCSAMAAGWPPTYKAAA
jgi:hypothetical protein